MRGAWRRTATAVVGVAGIALGAVAGVAPASAAPMSDVARAAAPSVTPVVPAPCVLTGVTATCAFAAGSTSWTVPADIEPGTAVSITAIGQQGEDAFPAGTHVTPGGRPATVSAAYRLAVGTPLIVRVAGAGGDGAGAGVGSGSDSGSGGGVSAVLVDQPAPTADRTLVVAGSGGGGGEGALGDPVIGIFIRGGAGGDAGLLGVPAATGGAGDTVRDQTVPGSGGGGGVPAPHEQFGAAGVGGRVLQYPPGSPYAGGCDDAGVPATAGAAGGYFQGAAALDTDVAVSNRGLNPFGGGGGAGYTGGGSGGGGVTQRCVVSMYPAAKTDTRASAGGGGGGSSYADPASVTAPTSSLVDGRAYTQLGSVVLTYQVDVTAPSVTLTDVADPRSTPVGEVDATYSEPVIGGHPQFQLTRDGVPVDVSLAGLTSGPTVFGVDLSNDTVLPGTYVYTVFAAGITDVAGNPVAGDVSRTWVNRLMATFTQPETPRATALDSVDITFSSPVTGVDLGDFRLFLNGAEAPFENATLSGSGADYTISGLGSQLTPNVTAAEWEIALSGSDTGITAGGHGPPPSTSVVVVIDASTPPVATFSAVAPTVVAGPDTIAVNFSQPVHGVDISAFRVFRDGSPTALTGATIRCTAPDQLGSCISFVIEGVGDLFSPELFPVAWELDLSAGRSSITNEQGVHLADDATVAFTVLAIANPTVSIAAVPTPRATGIDSLDVTFSQPVYAVDLTDFDATRDGTAVPLDGAVLTPTGRLPDGSCATYTLSGLGDLTAPGPTASDWTIGLHSDNSFITDVEGQELVTGASTAFHVLAASVPTAGFEAVATPRADALDTAVLDFSEPVTGVDSSDFTLTRDGTDVPLTGVSVTGDGAAYSISGLGALTAPGDADADYVLTLLGPGSHITGDVGQAVAGGATLAFRVAAVVQGAVTTTALGRSGTPAWTSALTLTASVSVPFGAADPPGTVTFAIHGASGVTVSCQGGNTVGVVSGSASCVLPKYTLRPGDGDYLVTVVYSGGSGFVASDATDTLAVPGPTSTLGPATASSRRAGFATTLSLAVTASQRRTGGTSGVGRVLVVDSRGRYVRCDPFSLMPGTPTFGCTIPASFAKAGTYTVYARYFHSAFDGSAVSVAPLTLS